MRYSSLSRLSSILLGLGVGMEFGSIVDEGHEGSEATADKGALSMKRPLRYTHTTITIHPGTNTGIENDSSTQ